MGPLVTLPRVGVVRLKNVHGDTKNHMETPKLKIICTLHPSPQSQLTEDT